MTIKELKNVINNMFNSKKYEELSFKCLKENKDCFRYKGVYFLADNDIVIYIGSSYVRTVRQRLLQYRQKENSGNKSFRSCLIKNGKATPQTIDSYILKLKICAFEDETTEYRLIKECPTALNKVGK